ncbi:Ribosomal protein L13 superfamily [Sesbania bispinosa]|nr:Ribosomal protein L13 superfamily [Sesbania bispinosa]
MVPLIGSQPRGNRSVHNRDKGTNLLVEICISGEHVRQKMKYMRFLRKHMIPSTSMLLQKTLWGSVRGIIPHRTKHGSIMEVH